MIGSFRHSGLKRFFEARGASRIDAAMRGKIERILDVLHAARSALDLDLPSYRLHPLKGGMKGFWAVAVNANWRIVFRFEVGDAVDVNLLDYH